MINFQEEIKRFKPSLDVDDIEKAIAETDLTDMNDIMMQLFVNASRPTVQREAPVIVPEHGDGVQG